MSYTVYVASHCEEGGILRFELSDSGEMIFLDKHDVPKPSYFSIDGCHLYALLREPFLYSSGLQKFKILKDGSIVPESGIESVHGTISAHLYAENGEVYVANYINGTLIKMPDRMLAFPGYSHPHCVCPTPDGKYICMTDLGTDTVYVITKDMTVKSSVKVTPGSGPRHLLFSPDGRYCYCANQENSTVSVLVYQDGLLEYLYELPTIPSDFSGKNQVSAIRLSSDGRRLFISNRGYDSAAVFEAEGDRLSFSGYISSGGTIPREMLLLGDLLLFGNIGSDNVSVYDLKKEKQVFACSVIQPWGITGFKNK